MLVRGIFFSLTYVLSSMFPSISQVAGESGGYYFLGKLMSHAEYEPWNWRANTTLQFYFKTWSKSKMMMFYQEEKTHGQHMDLFLIKGKLRLRVKMGQNMVSIQKRFIEDKVDFADSGWHEVKIELSESEIRFFVNSTDGNVYSADPIPYTEYNPSTTSHQNIESLLIAGLPFRKGFKWTELSYPSIFKEVYGVKPISFQGCIGNIRFNRIPNGRLEQAKLLTSPSEAENNCTGACAERPQRCANGGRCVDYIKYSECDCTGIGYQGGSCEKRSTTVYIKEKGHISYSLGIDSPLRSTERNTLDFLFLTNKATDGVFFYMRGNKDHLLVELVNGRVRAQANVGGDTIEVQSDKGSLNDSCWHFVEVKRRGSRLTLIVDKVRTSGNSSTKKFKELNLNNHSNVIYFGGGPAKKIREKSKSKTLSFNGYLQKFRFEGMDVLENALSNTKGFSGTEVNRISSSNTNLIDAQMNCKQPDDVSGDCSSDDDDSEICATSTPTPTGDCSSDDDDSEICATSTPTPTVSRAAGESEGYYFFGEVMSHAEYEPWNWLANATLQFYFKTWSKSKMMMFYQEEKTHGQHMDLFLIKGKLRLRVKMGQNMASIQKRFIEDKVDFADSGWHEVKIELFGSEIRFFVNSTDGNVYSADPIPYTEYIPTFVSRQNIESLQVAGLVIGEGLKLSEMSYPSILKEVYGGNPLSFQGCIGNIRFNRIPNGRLEQARLRTPPRGAVDNCTGACAERTQRCSNGGRCVDHIKYSECDCTGIGYEGGSCEIPVKKYINSTVSPHVNRTVSNGTDVTAQKNNTRDDDNNVSSGGDVGAGNGSDDIVNDPAVKKYINSTESSHVNRTVSNGTDVTVQKNNTRDDDNNVSSGGDVGAGNGDGDNVNDPGKSTKGVAVSESKKAHNGVSLLVDSLPLCLFLYMTAFLIGIDVA